MILSFLKHRDRILTLLLFLNSGIFCAAQSQFREKKGVENEAVLYETSGRFLNELLQIFANPPIGTQPPRSVYDDESSNVVRILGRNDVDRRRFPSPSGNNDGATEDERAKAWSELTREVLRMFRGETPTTTFAPTTTQPPSFAKRLGQLVPSFLNPFSENKDMPSTTARPSAAFTFATLPTLPPFTLTTKKPNEDTIFSRISSLFSGDSQRSSSSPPIGGENGPQIDTGRNFERFVVRENAESENPLASILGGKFKERGIEWHDGNLRFVNKQGSKLLGTDLAVHDRSVDIPVDRWLILANELIGVGARNNN